MSVLVFLCFLKRRIADKNRADTGVCPYTHVATLNRPKGYGVRNLTVICSNCSPTK